MSFIPSYIKHSPIAGLVPSASQLVLGELFLNTADGVLYFQKNSNGVNSVVALGAIALTANALTTARTISLAGDLVGNASFNGSSDITIISTLANSGVAAGTYSTIIVNAKGVVTNALSYPSNITITGDMTGNTVGNSINIILKSTNPSVGFYGSNVTVPYILVNSKGLISAVSNVAITFPVNQVFGRQGNISLLTTDIISALGYTPISNTIIGIANGVASLDSLGRVPVSQLPSPSGGNNPVVTVAGRFGNVVLSVIDISNAVSNAVIGIANGIATLDSSGLLSAAEFPTSGVIDGGFF